LNIGRGLLKVGLRKNSLRNLSSLESEDSASASGALVPSSQRVTVLGLTLNNLASCDLLEILLIALASISLSGTKPGVPTRIIFIF